MVTSMRIALGRDFCCPPASPSPRSLAGMKRAVAAFLIVLLAGLPASSTEVNVEPPVINVTPPKGVGDSDTLRLEARIVDDNDLGTVALYAKGQDDSEYRRFDMQRSTDDTWFASLLPWPQRGERIVFYIEATDSSSRLAFHMIQMLMSVRMSASSRALTV